MRLIDADTLMADLLMGTDCNVCPTLDKTGCEYDRVFTKMNFCEWIDEAPTVDAVPVVHGRWETVEDWDGDEHYQCSECKAEYVLIDGTPSDNDYLYCPNCGARMDGEQHGQTE